MSSLELRARELEGAPNLIKSIHYACENFFTVKDRPVTVVCISIVDFISGAETVFALTDTQADGERHLLERYYKFTRENADALFVHWNMNGADFGFSAIDNRYHYITGKAPPHMVPEERRFNLDTLIRWRYGKQYADPTLEIKDEYDVQDLMHSLFRVFFDDVRAEEWTPKYAGGNKRIDFLIPTHSLAVELKHTRPTMKAADLGDELTIDVAHYKAHPKVRHLVCLVFDKDGHIANPRGIESDLTSIKDDVRVTARIIDN